MVKTSVLKAISSEEMSGVSSVPPKPNILIVDDRKENLLATEKVLRHLDANIFQASSGNQALSLILRHAFAVVLLDVQMPEMDGFETALLMQEHESMRGVPIIFVTAISKEEKYATQAAEIGAVDYIFKPINPEILKSKVKVYLDLHMQREQILKLNAGLWQSNEELEHTAHRLRISEEKYRVLMEQANDAILMLDLGGVVLETNRKGETLLGRPRKEIISQPLASFLMPDQIASLRQLLTGDSAKPVDLRLSGKNNQILTAEVSVARVPMGEQQVLLFIARDITARQQLEQQLHQAQKMEAIGNLTGGMAHDFNNLLGIIIGNLDLLSDRLKNDEEKEPFLCAALDATLRGADLTRRLLAFARQQPLQPQSVDPNKLTEGITKLLSRMLGEDVEISLNLAAEVWPVVVDPAQLEAAITNLATNARDAMLHGGRLTINTGNRRLDENYAAQYPEVTPGDYAVVEVSDNGAGMPPEVISHIFEPFFTTKERDKGTGLGLAMVFGFMKQSNGHISVYSEVGAGTTFRLYLPRATGENARDIQSTIAEPLAGGQETVLVVEDNGAMRGIVVQQLKELGYRVLESDNAASAMEVLEANHGINLLFSDIVMPGKMNGIELARQAFTRWPSLKIVLTSGFPETKLNGQGDVTTGLRLLSKPYRKADLARILREVLEGKIAGA
ncbi:MAG: response regulator [Proteobacteria bacterium]|nr:response regulator [Pseudomonadota bacterium]